MTGVAELLPAYLGRQRWFAGNEPPRVDIVAREELTSGLEWLLVDAGGALYQVVVGVRPADDPPEFLHGHEHQVLGAVGAGLVFDATLDPEYSRALLARVCPQEAVELVRPMGTEQSNTSLVFDDRLVLKLFRRVHRGPNPDVEITTALAAGGFTGVPETFGTWREGDLDLAIASGYLAGGAEGWALALTSLRDLYATGCPDPADCGGDFAAEARRLGSTTAEMHLVLARTLGTGRPDVGEWADGIEAQLERLGPDDADRVAAKAFVERLRAVPDAGAAVRVHGDYHLGQAMRTDAGWFLLDFEGEPARPLDERRRPSSPLRDVAGMARSFHYAAEVALSERAETERDDLTALATAWEQRNRAAFLDGYFTTAGIDAVVPSGADRDTVLAAFELDKAIYEVLYERAYRPDWVDIPRAAVARLLAAASAG